MEESGRRRARYAGLESRRGASTIKLRNACCKFNFSGLNLDRRWGDKGSCAKHTFLGCRFWVCAALLAFAGLAPASAEMGLCRPDDYAGREHDSFAELGAGMNRCFLRLDI